jgi:hypothetical protein
MGAINSTGDVLVVRAEPLGHYLRLWRNRYVAEHPPPEVDTQAYGGGSLIHFGASQLVGARNANQQDYGR